MTTVVTVHHVEGEHQHECRILPTDADLEQVRALFNPSNNEEVCTLKHLAAAYLAAITKYGGDGRLTALARTAVEEASMWAVKSATAGQ